MLAPPLFLLVIPAQAGIQCELACEALEKQFGVLRTRTSLDPGLRRDDERKSAHAAATSDRCTHQFDPDGEGNVMAGLDGLITLWVDAG